MNRTFYPGLDFPVAELSAYGVTLGIFTISLKSGDRIIQFKPVDMGEFKKWLDSYKIRNIDEEINIDKLTQGTE